MSTDAVVNAVLCQAVVITLCLLPDGLTYSMDEILYSKG